MFYKLLIVDEYENVKVNPITILYKKLTKKGNESVIVGLVDGLICLNKMPHGKT